MRREASVAHDSPPGKATGALSSRASTEGILRAAGKERERYRAREKSDPEHHADNCIVEALVRCSPALMMPINNGPAVLKGGRMATAARISRYRRRWSR